MKRILKSLGMPVLVVILCGVAFIGGIEGLRWWDERHLQALVMELPPGTPFSAATERLGQPHRVVVDPAEMPAFRHSRKQTDLSGPRLNLFVYHRFYWVLVFTDADSKTILHAEWNAM